MEESARTLASAAAANSTTLPGKYRNFFLPDAHRIVHDWYFSRANAAQRHAFKQLIKEILEFDLDGAASKMRPTFQTDLVQSSALVTLNGGKFLTNESKERASVYLSYQNRSKHQMFRETFGVIEPPRTTALPLSQTKLDFKPARMVGAVPSEESLFRSGPIIAESRIKKPSDVTSARCEVIGPLGATAYGTMYPWKVAPKSATNIQQRAHEASMRFPPWGSMENPGGHWVTHSKEAYSGHEYRFDQPELLRALDQSSGPNTSSKYAAGPGGFIGKRRFQNYNDNYCDALLFLDRKRRKGELAVPSEKEVEECAKRRDMPAVVSAFAARSSPAPLPPLATAALAASALKK